MTTIHLKPYEKVFADSFSALAEAAHANSASHGFWDNREKDPISYKLSRIALMHSELSEAVEGIRKGLMDDHLPHCTMEEAELADVIIRVLDYSAGFGLDVGRVVIEKMRYNEGRPHMHGDKAL